MTLTAALLRAAPFADGGGPPPGDYRGWLVALAWCLGSLVVAGIAWAALRRLHDRRARREEDARARRAADAPPVPPGDQR